MALIFTWKIRREREEKLSFPFELHIITIKGHIEDTTKEKLFVL